METYGFTGMFLGFFAGICLSLWLVSKGKFQIQSGGGYACLRLLPFVWGGMIIGFLGGLALGWILT